MVTVRKSKLGNEILLGSGKTLDTHEHSDE